MHTQASTLRSATFSRKSATGTGCHLGCAFGPITRRRAAWMSFASSGEAGLPSRHDSAYKAVTFPLRIDARSACLQQPELTTPTYNSALAALASRATSR